jgi:hypothetical protein
MRRWSDAGPLTLDIMNSRILVLSGLSFLFIALPGPFARHAHGAEPIAQAKVIPTVPYTITRPGNYVMQRDLVYKKSATGTAITVAATGVTIDLCGHTLSTTVPADDTNATIGIAFAAGLAPRQLTVRNGTIKGFATGLFLQANPSSEGRILVEDISIERCHFGMTLVADTVEVVRCRFVRNGFLSSAVVAGVHLILSSGKHFVAADCRGYDTVQGQGQNAFGFLGSATVSNRFLRNELVHETPIHTVLSFASGTANCAVGNVVSNAGTGILFLVPGKYQDNLTFGVTTPFSGGTAVGSNN